MAGMQFEYDEEGGTFFYFVLSFWALLIIPSTYYLWPSDKSKDDASRKYECHCEACEAKKQRLRATDTWKRTRRKAMKLIIVIGWVIFFLLVYKVSKIQLDYVEYDPYQELGLDNGASQSQIRKAYRKLTLVYHPDKATGDSKKFMRIAKAYAALTDEESRKNLEEFGNPDGPTATRFGIALPKWIVEKENSVLVLGLYGLVFMIILPVVVGVWWYRSIKFSGDQVLLDTTRLYYYFFHKTPNMIFRRVIMILASSWEFDKLHNSEIVERPSDNEEIPVLMRNLSNLGEKNKEKPLCFPYSVKARALLHSQLNRVQLPPNTLQVDLHYILKKCAYLINEMINCVAQLVAGAATGRVPYMPRLETVENCMKLSQCVIQGLEEKSSPLLQLPHITQDMLKYFTTKKRSVRNIRDFISLSSDDRRSLLRNLSDAEYNDTISVCARMPFIDMVVRSEVLDDDDSSVTAGSIVTVSVFLHHHYMESQFEVETLASSIDADKAAAGDAENGDENGDNVDELNVKKPAKAWQKKGGGGKKKQLKAKKKTKQPYQWKAAQVAANAKAQEAANTANAAATKEAAAAQEKEGGGDGNGDAESDEETHSAGSNSENENEKVEEETTSDSKKSYDDDDEDWSQYQEESKKENQLEAKIKESHVVHCPFFPLEKQEYWWLYLADRKCHMLVTAPVQICTLKDLEEVKLKFSAPPKPGVYTYSVILRSDCYLDFDQIHNIKLDVKEAKIIEDHPQWDIESDEEDKDNADDSGDSDYSTDEDDSD